MFWLASSNNWYNMDDLKIIIFLNVSAYIFVVYYMYILQFIIYAPLREFFILPAVWFYPTFLWVHSMMQSQSSHFVNKRNQAVVKIVLSSISNIRLFHCLSELQLILKLLPGAVSTLARRQKHFFCRSSTFSHHNSNVSNCPVSQ